jgi:hypothetical protein
MGLPDDNPSSFGDHYGFGCHAGLYKDWQAVGNKIRFADLQLLVLVHLFSQKHPDQQPSSTSDCCSSCTSSPNGSTR